MNPIFHTQLNGETYAISLNELLRATLSGKLQTLSRLTRENIKRNTPNETKQPTKEKQMTTEKSIKLKTGATIPAGLPVTFLQDSPSRCLVRDGSLEYRVRVTSAFHAPEMDELEEANNDGVCPSIGGEQVEPDGWDSNGAPSWLLALGLI